MNRDFVELLSAFIDHQVDHLVVGAHALAAHGHVRATKDLDVWIRPTPENAARAYAALQAFGAPLFDLEPADLSTPTAVLPSTAPAMGQDIGFIAVAAPDVAIASVASAAHEAWHATVTQAEDR